MSNQILAPSPCRNWLTSMFPEIFIFNNIDANSNYLVLLIFLSFLSQINSIVGPTAPSMNYLKSVYSWGFDVLCVIILLYQSFFFFFFERKSIFVVTKFCIVNSCFIGNGVMLFYYSKSQCV
jgi:hypothetical protein